MNAGLELVTSLGEEQFQAIFEASPDCIQLIAPDGTLLQINAAGLDMLGARAPDAIVGSSFYSLIAPEFREVYREFNEEVCRGSKGVFQFELVDLNGVRQQLEVHAAPLRSNGTTVQLAIARGLKEQTASEGTALLLGAIVDSSDDAIISKDLNGVVMSWNKSAEQLFGYTEREAIGKTILELVIPEDRQEEETDILNRLRRGERVDHFETVRRRKDGKLLDISLTISPVRNSGGRVIGASKIARDISERKRAQRTALLLSAIVDSSDDAIISKDLNGVITSWNQSAVRLFGYTAEEAIGKTVAELLIPPDRQDEEPNILARLRNGERVDHFETIRRRKDGSQLDISLTISPVKNAAGQIIGASKVARDISDRKRAEKAIAELNRQLKLDLSAMTRMQQLSTRLVQAADFPQLLEEIVTAGMEITGADIGNIQLIENGALGIVAHCGCNGQFLKFFGSVREGEAACGTAWARGVRVIVENVAETSLFTSAARDVLLAEGIIAVQSTPLVSRNGQILGTFSTHYRGPHQTTDREQRLLDILARQATDLIERKRAEAALLASEAKFRQLADSMPQIVWTANPHGLVDYYNERWYQFTGFINEDSLGSKWEQLLHPDDFERSTTMWQASIQSGQPFETELRFWDRRENRFRWFICRALPVRDAENTIVKWFGSSTEIDEQKRVENELRRANQDLEQFAFSATHDLQEPLRSVKIYSELLTKRYRHKLDGDALEYLDYLRTGATRMEMLVRDLLSYTRVAATDQLPELTDANEMLRVTLENLAGSISEAAARISSGPLPNVRVHASHLQQLFQNIIGNAIKYRSPERDPEISINAESDNGYWTFAVTDNGIGIQPEYREGIFGLFKRLHTNEKYSGTGIGLAICQRIVERYRGRIWVESEPGRGSTFRFTLPG
jgi:PAS domain S-box-containing protein